MVRRKLGMVRCQWYDDHPLTVLPHLDESDANRLGPDLTVPLLQMGLSLFEEKSDSSKEKKFKQKFVAKTTLDEKQINEVMNAVKRYPTVTPRHLRLVAKNEEIDVSDFGSVGAKTQRKWIKVSAGALFRLKLDLHVAGSDKFAAEAFLPLWPKEKAAGWMILAADLDTDQLLSFSYVPPVRGSQCARIEVKMPSKSGRFILSLVMMSDCYLGIDQEYSIPVEVC
ncbi:unnamed protein product [Caenorhabditis auriculariae]|uniref:SEC63 domain-containing protein n=1 Tax=Caenorhabditis auriculariae TaxID=2777116 RepID=A0A8S1HXM8_9PELO|nr:unnamed protein product [Caenorhabditis auriculariae]